LSRKKYRQRKAVGITALRSNSKEGSIPILLFFLALRSNSKEQRGFDTLSALLRLFLITYL
jgi:hypothetical protein